ncbi:hypothetical protein ACH4FX_10090 [Streptomyces sp. NPDC018019]|uniref:hypothetical protein n=1 Tax=Streptomyces sp. NPDC018019 TaxID=3365030 RepID=UPI00378B92F2
MVRVSVGFTTGGSRGAGGGRMVSGDLCRSTAILLATPLADINLWYGIVHMFA